MNKELMDEIIEAYMEENGLDDISEQDYDEIAEAYLYFTEKSAEIKIPSTTGRGSGGTDDPRNPRYLGYTLSSPPKKPGYSITKDQPPKKQTNPTSLRVPRPKSRPNDLAKSSTTSTTSATQPKSFADAFRIARKKQGGAGGVFKWKGKEYQTNIAGEKYVKNPTQITFGESAGADHGNMNNGSPRGEGLSPSAKREMDRQTPMPKDVNEPEVEKRTWDAFRATNVKVAAGRRGDSSKGDKKIINKPEDITARASRKEDDGFKTGQVDVSVKA